MVTIMVSVVTAVIVAGITFVLTNLTTTIHIAKMQAWSKYDSDERWEEEHNLLCALNQEYKKRKEMESW